MILKSFELNKVQENTIFYLLYGKNEGLKDECINEILKKKKEMFSIMMKTKLKTKLSLFMKIYYLVHCLIVLKSY